MGTQYLLNGRLKSPLGLVYQSLISGCTGLHHVGGVLTHFMEAQLEPQPSLCHPADWQLQRPKNPWTSFLSVEALP